MSDRASDPCEGARQRIAERLAVYAAAGGNDHDRRATEIVDAEFRPLVEASREAYELLAEFIELRSDETLRCEFCGGTVATMMDPWAHGEEVECELADVATTLRQLLAAARTPRRTSDGE